MNLDPIARGQLSPGVSALIVFVVISTLAVGLAWALFWWTTQKRRGAEALASVTAGSPPARGTAVLHGVVETEDPERPAITVTLWETGTEQKMKSGWVHTWTEERREVRVEPFYLKLKSGGTIVRVEPDEDVFLADSLELVEGGNPRKRCARLTNGESAFVSGVLGPGWHARLDARSAGEGASSAYRGGRPGDGLVLRSGRDRMLVSTEPLDQRFARQAKAHRLFALVFGVALAIGGTLVYGSALATTLFGKAVDAEVVSGRHWTTRSKNTTTHHFSLIARYQDAAGRTVQLEDEVNQETYDLWSAKRLPRLPFVVAFDSPALCNVGERATIGHVKALVPLFVTFALLLLYRSAVRGAREWYDQKIVITQKPGRLA